MQAVYILLSAKSREMCNRLFMVTATAASLAETLPSAVSVRGDSSSGDHVTA